MSLFDDNWDYTFDLNEVDQASYREYEMKVNSKCDRILNLLLDSFSLIDINYNGATAQNGDQELQLLIESNKQLRHEIDLISEEISCNQVKYENFKKDQKLMAEEIKETHEAFLMAKKYYKKLLKFYYTIEKRNEDHQIIFIQFFTETRKDSEMYTTRFRRTTQNGIYELIETSPKIDTLKELQKRLKESNDVSSTLWLIRQTFLNMKKNKK